MGDVLSQDEIDRLFDQFSRGDTRDVPVATAASSKEARIYDFAHPTKFSKEQLRTLENIFENFSRFIASFLTGYLRTAVHLEVLHAEEQMYRDFNVSLMNPVILAMTEWRPLKGTIIMELSNNIGYTIIDRILGGPGLGLKNMREFSEIEKILLERVMAQILNYLPEAWEKVIPVKPQMMNLETNAQFAQIMAPSDMVALVVLRIKIGGSAEGHLNFCLPHLVLEPVMDKLKTSFWFNQQDTENRDLFKQQMEEKLEKALIPISAIVGKTQITVNEFVNLQVGDVLKLDSYVNSDLEIMVGNLHKFYAKPGTTRGRYAFQISTVVKKEE